MRLHYVELLYNNINIATSDQVLTLMTVICCNLSLVLSSLFLCYVLAIPVRIGILFQLTLVIFAVFSVIELCPWVLTNDNVGCDSWTEVILGWGFVWILAKTVSFILLVMFAIPNRVDLLDFLIKRFGPKVGHPLAIVILVLLLVIMFCPSASAADFERLPRGYPSLLPPAAQPIAPILVNPGIINLNLQGEMPLPDLAPISLWLAVKTIITSPEMMTFLGVVALVGLVVGFVAVGNYENAVSAVNEAARVLETGKQAMETGKKLLDSAHAWETFFSQYGLTLGVGSGIFSAGIGLRKRSVKQSLTERFLINFSPCIGRLFSFAKQASKAWAKI